MEKEFSKGENIFMEGNESSGFYIIMRGRVKAYKLSAEGKEQILHIVGPKELLGAVSAFAGSQYPAHFCDIHRGTGIVLKFEFLLLTFQFICIPYFD